MANTTPNIGLTLPTGAEHVSRQIINDNNNKIDTAVAGKSGKELLGYKEDGDTASQAIADGSFVVWKGSLYKANGNISQGATLSALNLTAVPSGGFNDLQGQVDTLSDSLPWQLLAETASSTTVSSYTSGNYREISVVLRQDGGPIVANTIIESNKSSSVKIWATYRNNSNDLIYAEFIRNTAVLSVNNSGFVAYLYAR